MHVFVTGASGWVGSEVVRQLVGKGHRVTGLARSDNSAATVERAGGAALRGELGDLDALSGAANAADGVIHCAFIHDFSNYAAAAEADKKAIEAMGAALAGSDKPLLVTSGTAGLAVGRPATEDDPFDDSRVPRVSESAALQFVDRNVRVGVIRLPFSVHGDGDHGFVPQIIRVARQKGVSGYVDAGENLWPAVHRSEAARAYVLALEKGKAGARYHVVGDIGIPFREIAAVIGRRLDVPVVSVPRGEAAAHFGWIGNFVPMGVSISAGLTRERLGWAPTGPGLLEDLEHGTYFDAPERAVA